MILTAGPSITQREIELVTDAVKNAWQEGAYKYVDLFTQRLKEYTGKSYAMLTSSGTGALALAFSAIDIKRGDEVIVPDLCFFSPLDEIVSRGGKPVFVDVLPDTWCMNPDFIRKAITPKTKAIMPVYMYGNLPESEEIADIAKEHGLYVIDDACPAMGSTYRQRPPGSYADIVCFSFQGAKIVTTGLGGVVATSNAQLADRIDKLNRQGQWGEEKFFQNEHGFSYDMADLNAALGVAQLERLEELVNKKRLIHKWYKENLSAFTSIWINRERSYTRSNFWLSSIVPGENRGEVMSHLKESQIDTRPFFFPASKFPMYKEADTPVAHLLAERGINLPSGHNLTIGDIERVCDVLKGIL